MPKKTVELTLSDFAENFFYLKGSPFSLKNYPHMRAIYNCDSDRITMKFSRQCVVDSQEIELSNGVRKKASELKVGDPIVGIDEKTIKGVLDKVKNVWDNGIQPSYEIKTRSGHTAQVTHNHPFLTANGWVNAEDLSEKDLVMVAQNLDFTLPEKETIFDHEYTVLTDFPSLVYSLSKRQLCDYIRIWWNARGFTSQTSISLTSERPIKELRTLLLRLGISSKIHSEGTSKKLYTLEVIGEENKKRLLDLIDRDTPPLNYTSTLPDFYLEEIAEITYLGEVSTTGVEMEYTKTFLIDQIATHNTAKSTSLANILLARALMIPQLRQLYVSPAYLQTEEFAREKVETVIKDSPLIKRHFVDGNVIQNVLKKQFKNGSVINLRYALLNAERIRGISSDICLFDETQDLKKDVIGVIEETMSQSTIKKRIYVGTPKRTKGTLADYWYGSTQNEYAIRCGSCNHWNILGTENIGARGLICSKCGNPLSLKASKGEWVSTFSDPKNKPKIEGFRVCLLHFAESPWVTWEDDVIYKMENQSTALFHNETLGLEYDSGSMPITKEQLMQSCNPDYEINSAPTGKAQAKPSIMGIDYGPVGSDSSHTVVSIVQEWEGKFQVVYAKKFLGKEADYSYIHKEVPKLFKDWNCILLASDYGMGEAPNSEFRTRLGLEKVMPFQHLPSQKEPMRYNPKMRAYTLNKNYVMNMLFNMLKRGKLRLPRWEGFSDIANDFLNTLIEYDEDNNKQRYINIGPDDFVHATLFACMAGMFTFDNPSIRESLQ